MARVTPAKHSAAEATPVPDPAAVSLMEVMPVEQIDVQPGPPAPAAVHEPAAPPAPGPAYIGYIDRVATMSIDGWAMDQRDPVRRVMVVAVVNDEVVGRARCDLYRQDLRDNGYGDGLYAFHIALARGFDPTLPFAVRVDDAQHPFELTLIPGALPPVELDSEPPAERLAAGRPRADQPQTSVIDDTIQAGAVIDATLAKPQTAAPAASLAEASSLQLTLERLRLQVQRLQDEVATAALSAAAAPGAPPLVSPPPAETISPRARGLYFRLLNTIR